MKESNAFQIESYLSAGTPSAADFHLKSAPLPALKAGEVCVKNLWMSVDPYMRGRMIQRKSYIDPFKLNAPLEGGAIGVVESSEHPNFKPGDYVSSFNGWRDYFVSDGDTLEKIEAREEELPYFLGALGMPGLTAYGALLEIGKPKAGDTIFVSSAAGAVGSLVCQIAKLKGCKVIASVGSDEKVEWLEQELGVDHAFNYKTVSRISDALNKFAPDGCDIYFENVGGEHLEAALNHMNLYGRIVMCGMISGYNAESPVPGPVNLMQIIAKRLTMQGFLVFDFEDMKANFLKDMSSWISQGKIKTKQSILEGLDKAPEAFLNLFNGNTIGKMLIRLNA
jgi:hypothetical protein